MVVVKEYNDGPVFQVDAMKIGVKDFKKAYKNVNLDQIEVSGAHGIDITGVWS